MKEIIFFASLWSESQTSFCLLISCNESKTLWMDRFWFSKKLTKTEKIENHFYLKVTAPEWYLKKIGVLDKINLYL